MSILNTNIEEVDKNTSEILNKYNDIVRRFDNKINKSIFLTSTKRICIYYVLVLYKCGQFYCEIFSQLVDKQEVENINPGYFDNINDYIKKECIGAISYLKQNKCSFQTIQYNDISFLSFDNAAFLETVQHNINMNKSRISIHNISFDNLYGIQIRMMPSL